MNLYELTNQSQISVTELLNWFAKQSEELQVKINKTKQKEFSNLNEKNKRVHNSIIDLAALILAIKKFKETIKIENNSIKELFSLKMKRKKTSPKYQKLLKKKALIFELRVAGETLRKIANIITYKINDSVSHTYISTFLKREGEV